ncbi:class V lanthionine synthetase subunit LxmK [Streptomyces achromogenes]|uniref:class V lanthionine synthetase subunit LxmK n=1 Tax=Streptomyces achromogenes TaxID=67255 RepID=UPI00343A47C4
MQNKKIVPVDLDSFPEVDALLQELGLGPFVRETVTSPVGRNNAWAGVTERGDEVFVKRLSGGEKDVASRMRRTLAFESYASAVGLNGVRRPALLGSDTEQRLLVFERIVDARTGAELMVDEEFSREQAREVGRTIGCLHGTPPHDVQALDGAPPPFPPLPYLRGLPMSTYLQASAGELEAWRLIQGDTVLIEALERLGEAEWAAPRVPSHCDFRVDQLLIRSGDLYVADWEEFRLADPARDVGAFAGEWIFRSVLDLVTNRGEDVFADVEYTHELILQRGAEKMKRLLPLVREFWLGYIGAREEVDEGLAVRATAFAGWHLLDRLIAGAVSATRLSGIQRAAAGVGRTAVVSPEKFSLTLGFGDVA